MGARLGQHFLKTRSVARALVEAASIHPNDTVLEIGPGKGALTEELLKTGARVLAVEKDEGLAKILETTFASYIQEKKLHVIKEDIRDFDVKKYVASGTYVVAANIPYYITGEIIRRFLTHEHQPRTMALLVQKEVAVRIARDTKESILSLSVKAYGVPRIHAKVPRGNFTPPPSVDSAILVIENISRDFFRDIEEKTFFRIVRAGFSSKRKLLAGNLSLLFEKSAITDAFAECDIEEKARAEDVPLLQWKCLTQRLATGQ